MTKKLVAYFSASGVTKRVAEDLAREAKADIFEIVPKTMYTNDDLDWTQKDSRSTKEMNDKTFRPPILTNGINPQDYDVIYLGFPVWWYIAPTIINTFLEKYDFSNKKIVLFATSGSSGFGKTKEELQKSAKDANIVEGEVFKGDYYREKLGNLLAK